MTPAQHLAYAQRELQSALDWVNSALEPVGRSYEEGFAAGVASVQGTTKRTMKWIDDRTYEIGNEPEPSPEDVTAHTRPQPRFFELDELAMQPLGDGIRVSEIGEDGDFLILGHHDDEAAWRAFAQYQAVEGNGNYTWDDAKSYDITRGHAVFSDHDEGCERVTCSCFEDEVCAPCHDKRHDECDGESVCECSGGYDHDLPDGLWPCGCECNCDEYRWWVIATTTGHPVTWIRWSYIKHRAWVAEQTTRDAK